MAVATIFDITCFDNKAFNISFAFPSEGNVYSVEYLEIIDNGKPVNSDTFDRDKNFLADLKIFTALNLSS
jgi:hypothetical protein